MPLRILFQTVLSVSLFILGSFETVMNANNSQDESITNTIYNKPENMSNYNTTNAPIHAETHHASATVISNGRVNATISEETRLMHFLLERYKLVGKDSRPVLNHSEPVKVRFAIGLVQLHVDEEARMLVTTMWLLYEWHDVHMVWNPAEYGDIGSVQMESALLWLPDVVLFNTAEAKILLKNAKVTVDSNGFMIWLSLEILKSSCAIHIESYPFDRQVCEMRFTSQDYAPSEMELSLRDNAIDLSLYKYDQEETSGWNIIKKEADTKFAELDFKFHLERKVTFTTYILTLPCIFLATLTLVVFWLPADCTDRPCLAMSLFASFLVLLLILVEAAPPTPSSIPKLGIYYCFNMVLIILSIFLSALVVNVQKTGKGGRHVPSWLRVVTIQSLGRLFCLTGNKGQIKKMPFKTNPLYEEEKGLKGVDNDRHELLNVFKDSWDEASNQDPNIVSVARKLDEVKMILELLMAKRAQKEKEEEELKCIVNEWKIVATCLDRVFFVIYLICIILSLIFLFPRPV